MPFTPTVLSLLRLLVIRPDGVSREEAHRMVFSSPPEWVDRAIDKLLELGVAEESGGLVVPLPTVEPLLKKVSRLSLRINRVEKERDQAMDLVRLLFHGP